MIRIPEERYAEDVVAARAHRPAGLRRDSRGQYLIPKRLPPGTYQIQASRQATGRFGAIADHEKTRRPTIWGPARSVSFLTVGTDSAPVGITISALSKSEGQK